MVFDADLHGHFWTVCDGCNRCDSGNDVWDKNDYEGDSLQSLFRLADLTNGVNDLTEWLWHREDRRDIVGLVGQTAIREALWRLQLYSQRIRNVNLHQIDDETCEDWSLDFAKEELMQIRQFHPSDVMLTNIRITLLKAIPRLHSHQLHPRSQSLVFGTMYAEWIALSRLRQWSIGCTDQEIVTKLATDTAAWNSTMRAATSTWDARRWNLSAHRIPRPIGRAPCEADNEAYQSICWRRDESRHPIDMADFEDDCHLIHELEVTHDQNALESYLQRLRPLMGLPYGARDIQMNVFVGTSELAPRDPWAWSSLGRTLNDQVQRNRDVEAARLAYWSRLVQRRGRTPAVL